MPPLFVSVVLWVGFYSKSRKETSRKESTFWNIIPSDWTKKTVVFACLKQDSVENLGRSINSNSVFICIFQQKNSTTLDMNGLWWSKTLRRKTSPNSSSWMRFGKEIPCNWPDFIRKTKKNLLYIYWIYHIYIYIYIYLCYWKALKSSRIQKFLRPPRWSQQQVKRITPGLPEVQRCASSKHETTLGNSRKFETWNRPKIWWWGPRGDRCPWFFILSHILFIHFAKQEVVFLGLTQKIVILGGQLKKWSGNSAFPNFFFASFARLLAFRGSKNSRDV